MTLDELRAKYDRLARDLPPGTLVPADVIYAQLLAELAECDGHTVPMSYNSAQAARVLGVSPKTIAHWCHAGRFPGAQRSSHRGGTWIIPAQAPSPISATSTSGTESGTTATRESGSSCPLQRR